VYIYIYKTDNLFDQPHKYGFISHIPVQCTTEHMKVVVPGDKISTLHNCSGPSQTGPKPRPPAFVPQATKTERRSQNEDTQVYYCIGLRSQL